MPYPLIVRTTLNIDDEVLAAARALAKQQGRSIGSVISELARRALQERSVQRSSSGLPVLPQRSNNTIVTMELVNRLRDELP